MAADSEGRLRGYAVVLAVLSQVRCWEALTKGGCWSEADRAMEGSDQLWLLVLKDMLSWGTLASGGCWSEETFCALRLRQRFLQV